MVLRKLIVYSIVSPSFGLALLTVFVAASLPA
ncbi:putative membrane protein, partial [[Clostridium] sordellii VPI 9048]